MVKYTAWTLILLQSALTVQVLAQDGFSLEDALDSPTGHDRTTKAPAIARPTKPKGPAKTQPDNDFDLADALQPSNDKPVKPNKKQQGEVLTDEDLFGVGEGDYKPDKGKGNQPGYGDGRTDDRNDDQIGTMGEVGTIGGIVSAVAVALVGAITSYISYQKKKLCFGLQQSLNVDMMKSENLEAVAVEPQVQQTLLEPPNAEPPRKEENPV